MLHRESTLPRLRKCGRCLIPGNDLGVLVKVTGQGADRRAGFGGLESCGSYWACPWCSSKIANVRQQEVAAAVRQWRDGLGRGVGMATFTMRHSKGQRLKTLWDALALARQRMAGGSGWQLDQRAHGFLMPREVKTGKRAGQIVLEHRVPMLSIVEVTYGKNGWHVHLHVLLFLGEPTREHDGPVLMEQQRRFRELSQRMFARWRSALQSEGLDAWRDYGGLEAHLVTGSPAEVLGEYFAKNTFDGAAAAAAEMTRSDLKGGRSGNRTPFEVLRSITGYADYRDGDAEVWAEWEQGSRGRRSFSWSPGLRALVELPAEERTDEDIAAEDVGGGSAVIIHRESWHRGGLDRNPRFQALLLELAERDDGGELLRLALDLEGLEYTVPIVQRPPE